MPDLQFDPFAHIRAGDVAAFEALFRAVHQPLVTFGARYAGDSARAEELVQDLFLDIWRNRRTLPRTGSANAYLYAAVRNRALNLRRRDAVESEWVDGEVATQAQAFNSAEFDIDLDARALQHRLATAFAELPGRCALVMQMRWHGGLRHAEIAQTLGISIKGVEAQLARGLRHLRAALGVVRSA